MRSRYSAFVVGDEAYLRRTWDPATRPRRVEVAGMRWTGLEVLATTRGGPEDTTGTVAFRAHHAAGVIAEDSAFRRGPGGWLYIGPA